MLARLCGAGLAALLLVPILALGGETISDRDHQFSLTLPDGFRQAPPELIPNDRMGKYLHVFVRGNLEDMQPDIMLFIEDKGRLVSQESLTDGKIPEGIQARQVVAYWQGFDIGALEVQTNVDGVNSLVLSTLIPLKPSAIQLSLVSTRERQADMHAMFPQILNGLKGETNWRKEIPVKGIKLSPWARVLYAVVFSALAVAFVFVAMYRILDAVTSSSKTFAQRAAHGSWMSALLGAFTPRIGFEGLKGIAERDIAIMGLGVVGVLITTSFALAGVGLYGMKKQGWRGILIPAVVGILLACGVIALYVMTFQQVAKRAAG